MAAVFVPLSFWLFDTLVKLLGSISIDDVGADLCLFAISFNATTLLTALAESAANASSLARDQLVAFTSIALVVSLLLYVTSVLVIAPPGSNTLPPPFPWIKSRPWKVAFTVALGFVAVAVEVGVYVWMMVQ